MNFSELGRVVDQLVKDRGIQREVIIKAIEQAFVVAARKKFGIQGEYEAKYSDNEDDIEIFQYKNVVEKVRDPIVEIGYNEAKELDRECNIGDQLGIKIENPQFTRVDVQTVKQIIFQKVRDAEREILFKEFKHREGDLITGIARRYERGNVIVDLGKADAILPRREIIPGENFRPGDRIQTYLSEVVMTNRGPEIRLTRTSPLFLVKLFEMEVPEIQDGTIEIKAAAREPGQRAKIAVYTADRDIDAVGACVGMKGARVQNVVNELQGEKIDIVKWSPDLENFARVALAPADITAINLLSQGRSMDVIVEEDQLSLAIGRRGQNVRLAAMLTGWKINIISKTKLQDKVRKGVANLVQLDQISDAIAQVLAHASITSLRELAGVRSEDLQRVTGWDETAANELLALAQATVEKGELVVDIDGQEDLISASAVPSENVFTKESEARDSLSAGDRERFSDAEKRLREELAAFKLK